MNFAAWNCRGAGGKAFPRIFREMIRKYDIKIMALMETRISGVKADRRVRELGFSNWIRVKATGFAGGIWVLWNGAEVSDLCLLFNSTCPLSCCKQRCYLVLAYYLCVWRYYKPQAEEFMAGVRNSCRTRCKGHGWCLGILTPF